MYRIIAAALAAVAVPLTAVASHNVTTSVVPNVCNGECNATATAIVTGGSGNFTYQWSTVPAQTTQTATGLCAGTYLVVVTDTVNGDQMPAFATVTDPPPLVIFFSTTSVSCNGGSNGAATASAAGGTAPYTYAWLPDGETTPSISGKPASTYTVTVTDAHSCQITQQTTITQPPLLAASATSTAATCGNNNGTASVVASGGTPPYTYSWSPAGGTSPSATALAPGQYTVTVTDANACFTTAQTVVADTPPPSLTASQTNASCHGAADGTATVVASGSEPFTYAWSPSGGTNATATGLAPGSYTVTVTDAVGCTAMQAYTITEPPPLAANGSSSDPSVPGACDGSATVAPTGGTAPYSVVWSPGGETSPSVSNLCSGAVTATITDANGCTTTYSTTIASSPTLGIAFGAARIAVDDTTTLTFTLQNNDFAVAMNGITFTDVVPDGLKVSAVVDNPCVFAVGTDANRISVSNGSVATNSTCTLTVNVTGVSIGAKTNVWRVTSATGPAGPVTASITVDPQPSGSYCSTFAAAADDPLGFGPFDVAAGDFDADGDQDLALVQSSSPGHVYVRLNDGSGSFTARATYTFGGDTRGLIAGEFNGDGIADLAVSSYGTSQVFVLLGNGDGTFGAATPYAVASAAVRIAAGDFNGDGAIDLAVGHESTILSVLLNQGDGTFAPEAQYTFSGKQAQAVVAADVNNDGILDLAVAHASHPTFVTIALGEGDGSFTKLPAFFGSGNGGSTLTAADLDGDGNADLAVAENGDVAIFRGDGTGSFTQTSSFPTGSNPYGIVAADFDGDGHPDLAVTLTAGDSVRIAYGNGDATFNAPVARTTASFPFGLVAADFDNDGRIDLVTANANGESMSKFSNECALSVAKAFSPAIVAPGGTTTLSFTLMSSGPTVTGVSFTDNLPAGMAVAAQPNLTGACNGGTITANSGATSISLSDASLPAATTCTFTVDVTATADGALRNVTGRVTSVETQAAGIGAATLDVASPPALSKSFGAAMLGPGASTSLTFTVTNPNTSIALSGISFTDSLPSGMFAAVADGVTGTCGGGTIEIGATGEAVALSGATLAAGQSCTFSVNVSASATGLNHNVTSAITSNESAAGAAASADVTVVMPPGIAATFGSTAINQNASTTLSFTITNLNLSDNLTGIAFTNTLPSGLIVSTPSVIAGVCGGGTIVADAGTPTIALSGASLSGNTACTFTVNVTATNAGKKINTSGNVIAAESGPGGTATATLIVRLPAPSNVRAFALSDTEVRVEWDAVPGAASYGVVRSSPTDFTATEFTAPTFSTFIVNSSLPPGVKAYRYAVVAAYPGATTAGEASDPAFDIATKIMFTDDGAPAGSTPIKELHFTELLNAINAVRTLANIDTPFSFGETITAGTTGIKRSHMIAARQAIDDARAAMFLSPIVYSQPSITAGSTLIRANDIQELRDGVQ